MNGRNQILPLIAAITMVIDHIGLILFPSVTWLRIIGRISFPIFAFGIAQGVEYTSDFKKYILRILFMGIIAQPICMMAFGRTYSNILFTLVYGALVLWLWKREKIIWSLLLVVASVWIPLEAGIYGVLTILAFGILQGKSLVWGQMGLQIYYCSVAGSIFQGLSIFALPLIHNDWQIEVKLPKYMLYWFYPVHLLVIVAVKQWM